MKDVNHPPTLNESIVGRRSRRRRWARAGLAAVALVAGSATGAGRVHASTIVGEYAPGVRAADLGGELVVNSYGVNGLGVFQLSDGVVAVCVEAHVSHSVSAAYGPAGPTMNSGALDYLLWRSLGSGTSPSDTEAAGLNVAVWGITGAQRSVGGTIWTGEDLDIRVLGVGSRDDIESAARSYLGEAQRRRGPWTLTDFVVDDEAVSTTLAGPGGPISGRPITFAIDRGGARVWEQVVTSGDDGRAVVLRDETLADVLANGGQLTARTEGPGRAVEYAAPGSQRLAGAGVPVDVVATVDVPSAPTTTTTTPSPTTATTTTTTTPSPTTATSTTATSTTATSTTATSTTAPVTSSSTTSAPPSSTTTTTVPTTATVPTTTTTTPPTTTTTTVPTTTTTTPTTVAATTTTSATPSTGPPAVPTTGPPSGPPPSGPPRGGGPPGLAFSGSAVRSVMRIGAWLFAIGGVIVFAAAEARPRPRRYVDRAGRAVDDPPLERRSPDLAGRASTVGRHGQDHEPADR